MTGCAALPHEVSEIHGLIDVVKLARVPLINLAVVELAKVPMISERRRISGEIHYALLHMFQWQAQIVETGERVSRGAGRPNAKP